MSGINPKRWFYGLRGELQRRAEATRISLSGGAAEHWLTGELYRYLAANIGDRCTLCLEDAGRDLVLYPIKHNNWTEAPLASIEIKMVYRRYSDEKLRSYVNQLIRQVDKNGQQGIRKYKAFKTYGYLFAVFIIWNDQQPRIRTTFSAFRRSTVRILNEECTKYKSGQVIVAARSDTIETLLEEDTIKIGGATAQVGLAGQYLLGKGAKKE
ncbi:MAG: hypothetical protein A2268_03010 [Candidatus Raymondbacteria bacterium RifOxyA12_full_50_37]|uniref:Uncharacterized protein n=1 Tax=Candidatus Raymondbacteria bacterium RIFOXYD12_FULL_49_13 TaxID=1817890 RepID=A0A1F7F8W9_UNCRA|nr:MAG: hypothetical protein A2248_17115 [Candidatus Raymondbacteria bacterium RIFOXYA2_FULL_49_16]OGJ90747.1 MAG: hypothetical protein A2268_03010 [Candidatus Raymondbacteria bacterium RifOxyA12_full_50_37]OGJ98384.1 MAG: hypothetical protein A2453_09020 [Candidatus Raymondbacteria bacterium RIFOXYC2_FULL_50_21]OGK03109.1 MAG: hypothetical protein A2519_06850 [Candidatus Raymondbacteria bacterium RIFOXYD12_FULL_49_13]OGK06606.1 MAG: hypothetical protein A2487_03030 [Candidatus Raymondbacteria 